MKKFLSGFFFTVLTASWCLLAAGCAPTIIVNGERYQAMTPEEERTMMEMARQSLLHQPRKFSEEEIRLIGNTDPVLTFHYSGDRYGKATAVWQGKKRVITFHFNGHFLVNGEMGMYLDITDANTGTLNLAKEQQHAKEERAKSGRKQPKKR